MCTCVVHVTVRPQDELRNMNVEKNGFYKVSLLGCLGCDQLSFVHAHRIACRCVLGHGGPVGRVQQQARTPQV